MNVFQNNYYLKKIYKFILKKYLNKKLVHFKDNYGFYIFV